MCRSVDHRDVSLDVSFACFICSSVCVCGHSIYKLFEVKESSEKEP